MFRYAVGVTIAFLLLLILGGKSYFEQSRELQEARQTIEVARGDFSEVGIRLQSLMEEVEALTTPRHKEALRLVSSWKEICERIPMAKIIARGSEYHCAMAVGKAFMGHNMRLAVLKDPEGMIREATRVIIDRCKWVESEQPPICLEFGEAR